MVFRLFLFISLCFVGVVRAERSVVITDPGLLSMLEKIKIVSPVVALDFNCSTELNPSQQNPKLLQCMDFELIGERNRETSQLVHKHALACQCIAKNSDPKSPFAGDRPLTPAEEEQHFREQAKEAVTVTNQRLASLRNGMLFQSLIVANDAQSADDITKLYPQNFLKNELASSIVELAAKEPLSSGITVSEGIDSSYVQDTVDETHCISKRQYLAFKQIPRDDFFRSLGDSEVFNEEEWDYDKILKKAYTGSTHNFEDRLFFLQRNPLIKALFSTGNSGGEYMREQKLKVFKAIKTAFSDKDSLKEDVRSNFIASKRYDDFRKTISEVFSSPVVSMFVSNASLAEAKNLVTQEFPRTLAAAAGAKASQFVKELNDCAAVEIRGWSTKLKNCLVLYTQACPTLQTISTADAQSNDVLTMNLKKRLQDDDFSSEQTNFDYEEENRKICGQQRTNGSSVPMNFSEYVKSHCALQKNAAECTPDNRAALLGKFLTDLKPLPKAYVPPETSALSLFLTKTKFQSLTNHALEKVSQLGQTVESYLTDVKRHIVDFEKSNPDARIREIVQNAQFSDMRPTSAPVAERRFSSRSADADVAQAVTDERSLKPAAAPSPERSFAQAPLLPRPMVPQKSTEFVAKKEATVSRTQPANFSHLRNEIDDLKTRMEATPERDKRIARLEEELRQARIPQTAQATVEKRVVDASPLRAPTFTATAPVQNLIPTNLGNGDAVFPVYFQGRAELNQASTTQTQASARQDLSGASLFNIRYKSAESKTNESGNLIVSGPRDSMDIESIKSRLLESAIRDAGVVDGETYAKLQDSIKMGDVSVLGQYLSKIQPTDGNLLRLKFTSPGREPLSVVVMRDQSGRNFIPSFRSSASLRNLNLILGY
jgi:hypothetical protein